VEQIDATKANSNDQAVDNKVGIGVYGVVGTAGNYTTRLFPSFCRC
jgi:hypothetical protein